MNTGKIISELREQKDIQDLTPDVKDKMFFFIDTVLRGFKAKQAYT